MSFARGKRFDTNSQMASSSYKNSEYPTELENISKKQRFGLFSQPPGLSMGDAYRRPQTSQQPRGVLTNPKLQSSVEPSLFQFPNFTTINDPYIEQFKCKQIANKQREAHIPHDQPFKHTDKKKTKVGSEYGHMKEFDDKKFDTRHDDGSVKIQPKNFYTQPHKKGFGNTTTGHLFGPVRYQSDPYERAKNFDIEERAEHQSKILNQRNFISTQKKNNLFNTDIDTYGNYRPQTEGGKRKTYQYPGAKHTSQWKPGNPAKQGFNKTLGKFPEYVEEGKSRLIKRKQSLVQHTNTWKPNSQGTFARPSPPISNLVTNYSKMTSFRR